MRAGRFRIALERALSGSGPRTTWYATQKEHLLGWLREYDGLGYYGRTNWNRTAQFVYNHFQCAAGLVWMVLPRNLVDGFADSLVGVQHAAA